MQAEGCWLQRELHKSVTKNVTETFCRHGSGCVFLFIFFGAALVFRVLLRRLRLRFVSLFAATVTNFNKLQLHLPKSASRRIASHRMASGSSSGRSARLMATPSALAAAHTALFLHHPLFNCVPYAAARRLHNSICVKVL